MRVPAAVTTLALLAAPAGCGGGGDGTGTGSGTAPAAAQTALTVAVDPGHGGKQRRRVIECPGDPLCARLERTPRDAFRPVPPRVACTEIFGGPQTATVDGTLRGKPLHAEFSRENGCQIARWDRLEWLLGKTSGAAP